MALPILPNPSNFLGVALLINRSRDGPRFVFHYPPVIHEEGLPNPSDNAVAGDPDDDEELPASLLSHEPSLCQQHQETQKRQAQQQLWTRDNRDEHVVTESGSHKVPWEQVAGFPTKDLESILTPARAYHKRLFQLSLDPLVFVSYPLHVPENGTWSRVRKRRKNRQEAMPSAVTSGAGGGSLAESRAPTPKTGPEKEQDEENGNHKENGEEGDEDEGDSEDEKEAAELINSLNLDADGDSKVVKDYCDGKGTHINPIQSVQDGEDRDKKSSMTMFTLVFILKPKKHEVRDLVDIMFLHIIKKINKAYKYCQQRSDFVWKESKKILALKDKGREDKRNMSSLWEEILASSSLAASMQEVYLAVSQNKIAALQLETPQGTVTPWVQIPKPFHVADLPPNTHDDDLDDKVRADKQTARGLWLTTANSFMAENALNEPDFLDKNFTLLLMDNAPKIIAELEADPDESTMAMIQFVRHCKPTLSFYQVGQQSNSMLSSAQVRKFAQHFIFWRRAMAIPPLHARDMYILSPNCDMGRLGQAAEQWGQRFRASPPLVNFLAELSAAPRPYKMHCPSKSLREEYMHMLAWLIRGGWVTQLCTFAYVVIWPEIIYEVHYRLEADELAGMKEQTADEDLRARRRHDPDEDEGGTILGDSVSVSASAAASTSNLPDDSCIADIGLTSIAGPSSLSMLSYSTASPRPLSPTADKHTPAEAAAEKARLHRLADKKARLLAERATAHARRPAPVQTAHPSVNTAPHLAGIEPRVLINAGKATGRDSLYLEAVERRLRAGGAGGRREWGKKERGKGDGEEEERNWNGKVAGHWPGFCKYFDGRSALERVALHEDMKRREVWNVLTAMSEYLVCVRHW